MTRSRAAALAGVIIVPVAILAIVLASLIDDGDSGDRPAKTTTQPAARGATGSGSTGAAAPSSPAPGSGGAAVPDTSLHILDEGATPKDLGEKIGGASSDGTLALGELR